MLARPKACYLTAEQGRGTCLAMEIRELHSLRHCTQYRSLLFRLVLLSQPYGDVELFSLDFLWCDFHNVSFQLSADNAVIFISKPIALKFHAQAGKTAQASLFIRLQNGMVVSPRLSGFIPSLRGMLRLFSKFCVHQALVMFWGVWYS